MYKIRRDQFRNERRENIGKKNDTLRNIGANEVEGGGEDDNVENIIYEACGLLIAYSAAGKESKLSYQIAKMLPVPAYPHLEKVP
jgi:hypothetical protein